MAFPPLDSGVWQFWGVVVSIIALLVTVVVYLKQRNRKELSWQRYWPYQLAHSPGAYENRIRISFDGDTIPTYTSLRLSSTTQATLPFGPRMYMNLSR